MMDKIEGQVRELSSVQENREKVKALSAEIVVHGTTEKPYYEIKYFDLSDGKYHTGYSSYDLNNVFRWRKECFEIVKENEYDMISEQVRKLREVAEMYDGLDGGDILREAADTIESISAQLQAANMERSAEDCGGWIYCGDGNNLPKEPFGCIVTVIDTEPTTMANFETILPYQVGYSGGTWNNSDGEAIPFEVIAWMPAPQEPYHES